MTTRKTLTEGLKNGDAQQVLRMLQTKGVSPEGYAAIGKNEALLAEVVAAIQRHCLFSTPEDQILRVLEVNEAVWKDATITEEALKALGDPPNCPVSDENGLYCVGLFSETGNALKTFQRNWQAAVHVHGQNNTWKWDGVLFTAEGVKPRAGVQKRPTGLRWAVCELGRSLKGRCVKDARQELDKNKTMGMGQELPFLAALHPNWAVAMNGQDIPFVDAPDLQVLPDAGGRFYCASYLLFNRDLGKVELNASRVEDSDSYWGSGSLR